MENWYTIKNEAESVDIYLYEQIGGYGTSAKDFINELNSYDKKPLNVHINSVGGDVFEGFAIYNALKTYKAQVTVIIEGLAASIASVIAMGGDKIQIAENGMVMIHNPKVGVQGESKDLRQRANILDKIKEDIASVYIAKTGLDKEIVYDYMDKETWFTSKEAELLGLVDEITQPIKIAAELDLSNFVNADYVKNHLTNYSKIKEMDELKSWFENKVDELKLALVENKKSEVIVSIADEKEVADKLDELTEAVDSSNTTIENLSTEIATKDAEMVVLNETIETLKAEVEKYKATPTNIETENEPAIVESEKVVNSWDVLAEQFKK